MWKPDVYALHGHPGTGAVADGPAPLPRASGADSTAGPETPGGTAGAAATGSATAGGALSPLGGAGAVAPQPGAAVVLREFEFRDADIW